MQRPRFTPLAAWTAGIGLILAQAPASAQTPWPSPVNDVNAPQPVRVRQIQSADPSSPALALEVLPRPTISYPVIESPARGLPMPGVAGPQLNPSREPVPASRPCLRDRVRCLLERLKTPWPNITW